MSTALYDIDLTETVHSAKPLKVDREGRFIEGVKVIGLKSANGRSYDANGLRAAIGMYEGRQVNVDHPAKPGDPRSARDRFGWLEGIHAEPDGLYAKKLHYLKSHPMAEAVCEAAERNPALFGLSHNARGRERRGSDGPVVESILSVLSVDVVADAATTSSLRESKGHPAMTIKLLKEWRAELPDGEPRKVLALLEDAGLGAMPMAMDMPASGSSDDQIKAAFRAAVTAAFDDEKLDSKATLSRIKDVLKAYDKLKGAGDTKPAGDGAGGPPTPPTEESRKDKPMADDVKALREEIACRDLVEEAGLKFGKPENRRLFLKALQPLTGDERKALIEERQQQTPAEPPAQSGKGGKPRSASPSNGGAPLTEGKAPASGEEFRKSCFK